MVKLEILSSIRSISEQFEDSANEAMNNFDGDYLTFFSIERIDALEDTENAVFKIAIHNTESNEPKGTFSFMLSRDEVIELAKVLLIMFVPLPSSSQGH